MADSFEGTGRAPSQVTAGATRVLGLSELGGLQIDRLLPDYAELARTGRIYGAVHTVATAVVPVQTVPLTAAAFVVNNISTTKQIVPLVCGAFLGSGTAGIGVTLFAGVTGAALATQLTADTSGVTRAQGVGTGQNTSAAWVGLSKTVVANWIPVASADVSAAAVPGTGVYADCRGMFIVQPTYAFMLQATAGAGTTSAYCFWCIWAELPITVSI